MSNISEYTTSEINSAVEKHLGHNDFSIARNGDEVTVSLLNEILVSSFEDVIDQDGNPTGEKKETPPPKSKAPKQKDWEIYLTDAGDNRKQKAKELIRINIDGFKNSLLAKYTQTEQQGWPLFLPEAKAFMASENLEDAPGLSLQAAIEQAPLKDVAEGIIAAATITGMLPHLAAGVRTRATALIDATDGTVEAIKAVTDLLEAKQAAIGFAIQSGDQQAVLAAATSGWDI